MAASNVRQKALVIVLVCLLNLNNASVVDDTDVVQWPPGNCFIHFYLQLIKHLLLSNYKIIILSSLLCTKQI